MYDFISPILQWINSHPELAGLATFLISAAESIAIIGTIIPGSVMMTALGTLAGSGVMPLWSTVIWAILGAVVGDGVSYWIGYHYKDSLRNRWPFRSYPNLLKTGVTFFNKHGGKSVFIGRFVGPVRALVPLVAGMLQMQPWRFAVANITSAIGWAPAYMLPGILLGAASLELPPDIAVHAILMLLLVGLFIALCMWILVKLVKLLRDQLNQGLTNLWQKLHKSRLFFPITTLLNHYNPKKTYGQLTLAFYFIIALTLFFYLASYVYLVGSDNIFANKFFYHLFRSLRNPITNHIMVSITFLGESRLLVPVMLLFSVFLVYKRRWHTVFYVLLLTALTLVAVETFKHTVHSIRPWGILHSPTGYSFPSGHTTFSTVFYIGFALLLAKATQYRYARVFYLAAGLIIAAMGISRIYLGAHWLTDVMGGLLLGASLLMLVALFFNHRPGDRLRPWTVFTGVMLPLLVGYVIYYCLFFNKLERNSALIGWPQIAVTQETWWNQTNKDLPLYRLNRFGFATQILNLQWLGDIQVIKDTLIQQGWQVSPDTDWITVLHRISNVESTEHLPVVSPLYLDKKPALVLIKFTSNKRLIALRLWDSNVNILNSPYHLWVGTVELTPSTYSWLFKRKHAEISLNPNLIFPTRASQYDVKVVKILNTHHHPKELQPMVLIKSK